MQIVVRTATAEAELDVLVDERAATVTLGDVLERVTMRPAPLTVHVDGRLLPSSTPMHAAAVRRASVVDLSADPAPPGLSADVEVAVVAGVGSGRRRALTHGRYQLGPGRGAADLADGVVEQVAAELTTTRPSVSTSTTASSWSAPRAAGAAWRVQPAPTARSRSTDPRVWRPSPRRRRSPSRPVGEKPGAAALPLLALAAPLPVAVAIAAVLGEWRYLLFGLLSPVMLLANWIEDRRTRTATVGGRRRPMPRPGGHCGRTRPPPRRRRGAGPGEQPDLAELIAWAEAGGPRLWERRRAATTTAFVVAVGVGDRAWRPVLSHGPTAIGGTDELVAELGPLQAVPVVADLSGGGIGVVGRRRHAATGGILLTAVATHGPADLGVVVLAEGERAAAWEWTKWLPHAVVPEGAVVDDPTIARDVLDRAVGGAPGHAARLGSASGPLTVVVADGDRWCASATPRCGACSIRVRPCECWHWRTTPTGCPPSAARSSTPVPAGAATSSTSTGVSSTTTWLRCWSTTTWRSPRPGRSPGSTIRSAPDGSTGRR